MTDYLQETDVTLPLNFDASANPDQLGEITLGNQTQSPEYPTLTDGSTLGLVQKAGSGRLSPARARTMKDYEQQIEKLTKENFSLKLRIYYLEEGAQRRKTTNVDQLSKINIELNIKVESLKKDVMDKQELLGKARTAIDELTAQHQAELLDMQERCGMDRAQTQNTLQLKQQELEKAQKEVEEASRRVTELMQLNRTAQEELEETSRRVTELMQLNRRLDIASQTVEDKCGHSHGHQETQSRSSSVDPAFGVVYDFGTSDGTSVACQTDVDGGDAHHSQLIEQIRDKERTIDQLRTALKTKEVICDETEEERKEMIRQASAPLEDRIRSISSQLQFKDREIQTLRRERECMGDHLESAGNQRVQDLTSKIHELETIHHKLTTESAGKDSVIGKLEDSIHENEKESREQVMKVSGLEQEIAQLNDQLKLGEENALKRDKAIQGLMNAVLQKDEQIKEQTHKCTCKDETMQTLEEELDNARTEAERLRKGINRKEIEVSKLSEKLEESEDVQHHREDSMQALLNDVQRELEEKDKSVQRLSKKINDRETQLEDCMKALTQQEPMTEKREALVNSLRKQIVQRDKNIEDLINERATVLEGKEDELNELRSALRDRDRVVGKANRMLQATEHTIQTLRQESDDQCQALTQLNAAVKEKDREIKHMIQDHASERSNQEPVLELQNKLRSAEEANAHLQDELSRQSVDLSRQLHDLETQLYKKEYGLKEAERRLVAEQDEQDDLLGRIRSELVEKDETISKLTVELQQSDRSGFEGGYCPAPTIAGLQQRIESLQLELTESRFQNSSLQTQLSNHKHPQGDQQTNGIVPNNQLARLARELTNQSTDGSPSNSYLPSFISLPNISTVIPDDSELHSMSHNDLKVLVENLKCEILRSQESHLHSSKVLSCATVRDEESTSLEMEHLEQIVRETDNERQRLKRQLNTVLYGPTSDRDIRIIPILKEQLDDALHKLENVEISPQVFAEDSTVQEDLNKLRTQLKQTENLNLQLKKQIELNSDCRDFNPELVCQMAQEIERLKDLLDRQRLLSRSSECSSSDENQVRKKRRHRSGKSLIPKLQPREGVTTSDYSTNLQHQLQHVQTQLSHTKVVNNDLSDRLASTEATVRIQTDKMKFYRNQLDENGIVPRSPSPGSRSHSPTRRPPSPGPRSHSPTRRPPSPGLRSQSPARAPPSPGTYRSRSPNGRFQSELSIAVGEDSQHTIPPQNEGRQHGGSRICGLVETDLKHTDVTDLKQYNDYGHINNVYELKSQINDLKKHLGTSQRFNAQLQEQLRSGKTSADEREDPEDQAVTLASFYRFKAANEQAFDKLHKELEVRSSQLKMAEDLNVSLIGQGDQVEFSKVKEQFEHIIQELQNENIELRNKLTHSKALCAVLKSRLRELGESVDQLLHVDEKGNLDVLNLSPGRVIDLKKQLTDTQNMTSNLSVSLKLPHNDDDLNGTGRNFEVRQLGTSLLDESVNHVELDISYQNACEQIQKLELQLSKRGEYEDLNASRRIADTEHELDDLKHLNNELNRKIKEQSLKLKSFEQEKALAKERSTSLQQEVNRLRQEYLTLKEGLNSEQQNTGKYVDKINALQKQLDKARRDADEARGLVHEEKQKAHLLERDKDAMMWNVKRLTSERDGSTEERYGLEEKMIGLETLMAQLKDECNTLRVKHADQQAQIYKFETDGDKLQKTIQSKDEVIEKFKELVQDNQHAAEKLRDECQQLNDEEKTQAVSSLQSKLQRLQQTYGIPQFELVSDSTDLDFIPKPEVNQSARSNMRRNSALNESGAAQARNESSHMNGRAANGSGLRIDLSELADSSNQEDYDRLQQETFILKGQLQAEKELVRSLKSEIRLLENVNISQEKSAAQTHEGDFRLREHLEELRKLRLQLEESIEKNNKLEDLLTRQLTQLGVDGDAINQYIKSQLQQSATTPSGGTGEKQTARLLKQLDELKHEMDLLEQEVRGKDKEMELLNREVKKKDSIFRELEERIRTKDETLHVLTMESESRATQLIATTAEAKRLKDEMNRLRDALGENEELNKTLKLELSVYDKMADQNNSPALNTQNLDLNMLLEEIRQLRIQMTKTIENNNKLRRTLEENLAKNRATRSSVTNGDGSREELRGFDETETPRRSSVRFAHGYHDFEHGKHALSHIATADSGLATYDDPLDDDRVGSYRDPLYGILGETYIDRYFARKGQKSGLRAASLSRSHTVSARDFSPPTKLSDRTQSADARHLSSRRATDDTTGPLHAHDLTNGTPATPRQRLVNGTDMTSAQHSPRTKRLMDSLQGSARDNWRYDVNDPLRPPKYPSIAKSLDDSQTSGSTSQRVGADVRMLYSIGELDDYELLKKEISESHFIINGIEVRVKERLRSHKHSSQTDSLDYHTYRELASSLDQLKSLNGEASRLVALFWLSQLPVRDEFGNFIDVKLLKENQALSDELAKYKKEYGKIKHKLHEASRKMEKTSRLRDSVQLDMMKQLTGHRTNLGRANTNLYRYGLELPASASKAGT